MATHKQQLKKLENHPTLERLALVKEFSTEELRSLARMRSILLSLNMEPEEVFERFCSRATDRKEGKI